MNYKFAFCFFFTLSLHLLICHAGLFDFPCGCDEEPPKITPARGPALAVFAAPSAFLPQALNTPAQTPNPPPPQQPVPDTDNPGQAQNPAPAPLPLGSGTSGLFYNRNGQVPRPWYQPFANAWRGLRTGVRNIGRRISRLVRRPPVRPSPTALRDFILQLSIQGCLDYLTRSATERQNNLQVLLNEQNPNELRSSCAISRNLISEILIRRYGAEREPPPAQEPPTTEGYMDRIERNLNDHTILVIRLAPEHFIIAQQFGTQVFLYMGFQKKYNLNDWLISSRNIPSLHQFSREEFIRLLRLSMREGDPERQRAARELFNLWGPNVPSVNYMPNGINAVEVFRWP